MESRAESSHAALMARKRIVVLLDEENVAWLRAQAKDLSRRSLGRVLDALVSEARVRAGFASCVPRSVVGTVTFDASDADLEGADAAIRALFASSRHGTRR